MAAMLTVWGRVNSLNVQKVLWALAEAGVAYRRVDAGLQFGVNNTPAYLAMNPNGRVPTIDDDGLVLWESNVVVRYLAAKYAHGTLCPADIGERFLAERWMDWQQSTINPEINPLFMQLIRTPQDKRDMGVVAARAKALDAAMAILDGALAGRDFVNGRALTMGDIPIGTAVCRWYRLPVERQPRPNVEAWLARLKERPGFRDYVDQPLS